jgi:hypothetical protein
VQASQLTAIARWLEKESPRKTGPVTIEAHGPRTSLAALIAAACDERAVAGVKLHQSFGSLKEIIEQNRSVDQAPELFCFGLLERFDIPQITALVAPRIVERGAK